MNDQELNSKDSLRLDGVDFSKDIIWNDHVVELSVRVLMSCFGAAHRTTLVLLDLVHYRALRLIDYPDITTNLVHVTSCRTLTDLSLFYRYFHISGSFGFSSIMSRLLGAASIL